MTEPIATMPRTTTKRGGRQKDWCSLLATLLTTFVTTLLFATGDVVPAIAQETVKSPFGVPVSADTKPAAEPTSPSPLGARGLTAGRDVSPALATETRNVGPVAAVWGWLMRQQQAVNRQLSQAVRNFKTMDPVSAALILAGLSFAYGVLHAAGPGHGKAVISSYVLANEQTVRRGILLSFMAAGVQALSAIAIVVVLAILLNQTGLQIKAAENWITTLSWAFVAMIGLWLLFGQLRPLFSGAHKAAKAASHSVDTHARHDHACSDHADHNHRSHGHACHGHHEHDHQKHSLAHHEHDHHEHSHDGGVCPSCGHAHMPSPDQIAGPWSWGKALAVALAVGIRPCTGAVIVMIFALTQGLFWAGVFATFAMAIGTAITVSALAALAVGSRELAKRLADGGGGQWAARIQTAAGIAGALLITLFGVTFFLASLDPQAPF